MKFIELFAGIGGFRYGLEGVCFKDEGQEYEGIGNSQGQQKQLNNRGLYRLFSCVWANEIDKYACKIYRKNFGKGELYEGDIKSVEPGDIPDHDLLTGGFPCQAFSIAGKRGGFKDTRGTLFFEIAKVLQQKQPSYCLLENVKGILSHDGGKTFQTILVTLDELGYDLQWQVLNSKDFGVPQNRERVFIIGHLRGKRRPKVFPIRGGGKRNNKERKITATLRGFGHGWQGQHNDTNSVIIMRDGRDNRSCLRSGRTPEVGVKGMSIRRLTPTECERLQGFPDKWTEKGIDQNDNSAKISDTQRYKVLGNAITTNVITEIGKRLIEED